MASVVSSLLQASVAWEVLVDERVTLEVTFVETAVQAVGALVWLVFGVVVSCSRD